MTTPFTAIGPWVLPRVPGIPSAIAYFEARQAAIEFCKRSLAWRTTLPAVPSVFAPLNFMTALTGVTAGLLAAPFADVTRTDYVITFSDGSQQVATLTNGSSMVTWLSPVTATSAATYTVINYPFPATTDAEVAKFLKFTVNGIKRRVVTPDMGEDMVFARFQQQSWDDVAWTTDRTTFMVSPPALVSGTRYGCTVALTPTQTAAGLPDFIWNDYVEVLAAGTLARCMGMPDKPWTQMEQAKDKRAFFDHGITVAAAKAAKGYSRGRRRVAAHFF